ncbi:hypothetical protein FRB96_004600, partial [Tulasnella sp. 330]
GTSATSTRRRLNSEVDGLLGSNRASVRKGVDKGEGEYGGEGGDNDGDGGGKEKEGEEDEEEEEDRGEAG